MSNDFFKLFETLYKTEGSPFEAWTNTLLKYQSEMTKLWLSSVLHGPAGVEDSSDRRFGADAWKEGFFPILRHSYELTSKAIVDMADKAGLPDHEQEKLSFYARIAADNMAPSNNILTNPEAQKLAIETGGQSLVDGYQNLLKDLEKGYISTTDEEAFEVGKNLATTPGSVIFRNELIELIQYEPQASKTRKAPILIVPPCVNKFYIFDLNERKSMIRYLLEQGQSVYTIAWRNPGPALGDRSWDDYISDGIFEAVKVTSSVSKSKAIDILGWCNGGTMLIAALAVMPKTIKDKLGSATFLSSMIDFADPGQVKVFIDEPQVDAYNQRLKTEKVAPGRDIANAMAMLHVNESIWNFVVSNYLMGKSPAPFDVLYWNADTQNLPASWYSYYIEEMYMANKLKEPGALTLCGTPVDTRNIDLPCYFLAADGDHIVPWETSFGATQLVSGPTEFVLTTGGHVSGTVINHPTKSRRKFWTGGQANDDADTWRDSADLTEGSWWPHWLDWLDQNNPAERGVGPKTLGNKTYSPMEPAPGTYVHEDT